jgi:hypothetical protein|tara:strand:- start:808 stop:1977 length:1170 start_codon:yes stop_codon:yes gene_type:complete
MKYPLPHYWYFLIRHGRTSLLIAIIAIIVIILASWQLAYGLFSNTSNKPAPQTTDTELQESDATLNQSLVSGGETADTKEKKKQKKSNQPTEEAKYKEQTTAQNNSNQNKSGTSGNGNNNSSGGGTATVSLNVPSSGTVLTLSGLNYNLYNDMPQKFQGIFSRSPYSMQKVEYPASLASDSISTGVANLDAALKSTSGKKIVLAQSQGAQVASRWMREHANDPNAPNASNLTFILTGNPLRSTGGYLIGRTEVGGTTGQPTPTWTKWPIIDVARRYDGWADWVHNEANQWAKDNANEGKSSLHTAYDEVNIHASTHTIWKSGNTTYVLTKETDLPLWDDDSAYPAGVRAAMRAHIESAYNRPSNDPKTILLPIESAYWEGVLDDWGVPY